MIALEADVAAHLCLHGVVAGEEKDPWPDKDVSLFDRIPDLEWCRRALPVFRWVGGGTGR